MAATRVHYADRAEGIAFPICFGVRSFDSPTTRNTRKVTCKLCLALLDSR